MQLIFKFFHYIFLSIFFFPIYVLIRIISPILLVRFKILTSERIGHFVGEFDTYISEKRFTKKRNFDVFAVGKDVCNYFFLKKMKLPIYIGGGINNNNAKKIIDKISPNGLDVSRSLKDKNNNISLNKLNELRISLSAA